MSTEITINTRLGQIKGIQRSNALTKADLFSFQGIPYAAPPVGDLRFRPPQPHPGWDRILDATKEGGICAQMDGMLGLGLCGSDDCLYLNVYSPNMEPGANKAVMVFVHGGGFTFGHSSSLFYGPDLLLAKDVVLVTLNYRVNIFGFLNLGIEACPGNVGLKDMIAALQWVKDNISQFGGDPNIVTLFGESAGAASVHYLMMAPPAKGLFHRAILQSGTAIDSWAFHTTQESHNNGVVLAKALGCQSEEPGSVLEFLKNIPAQDLIKPMNQHVITKEKTRRSLVFPFVPSVEAAGSPEDRVVWDHPVSMMKQVTAQVPFLIGINSQEGLLLLKHTSKDLSQLIEDLSSDFERAVPVNMNADGAKEKLIASSIKQFFFGNRQINLETAIPYLELYSDLLFTLGHYETLSMFAQTSPGQAFAYLFPYDGELNVFKKMIMQGLELQLPGACHVDELGYLFYIEMAGILPEPGSSDEKVSDNMTTLWTNFAKTGKPVTESFHSWTPCSQKDSSYLNLDVTLSTKPGFVFPERYDFWKELYATYQPNFLKGNL
uniref:Carboxylic ester hydrolase n=1 Tax=Cacopsylla melanoneura TaxID=428564 RepID=A0A8D8PTT0_9HEMI